MKTVVIAIQARSTSERLPNKALRLLAGKPALNYVLEPCQYVSIYIRKDPSRSDTQIKTCLLVPYHDPIADIYRNQCDVIEGDEKDVLSRYRLALEKYQADYVVRVTGDCLKIATHIVSRHIKAALVKQKDYTSNVHFRTYFEGWDVEVISARLLRWLDQNATDPYDREHVTSLIAPGKPFPFLDSNRVPEICHVLQKDDESVCLHCGKEMKTSVDTKEEFEATEAQMLRVRQKKQAAKKTGVVYI